MQKQKPKETIGVFICHCGTNIAGTVKVEKLAEDFNKKSEEGIKAYTTMFLCSQIGQDMIKNKIIEDKLDKVVIASCSPKHHATIFNNCIGEKMNSFLWEMANIREQCSWVTFDKEVATEKARALINGAIEKARKLVPLGKVSVPITKSVLIIGGGIAGIQTALELANKDIPVILVEKKATIGGNIIKLDRIFPTDDCAMCTSSPILNDVISHKKIKVITNAEVVEVKGHAGEYFAKIIKHPRFVSEDKCTGCGECAMHCPVETENEFDFGHRVRTAIYIPFSQAVPLKYIIDKEKCIKCGTCKSVCKNEAIDYEQREEEINLTVGAIVVSTGYEQFLPYNTEYNYEDDNVITGLECERLLSPAGPTEGKLYRPSDSKIPKRITFIQCVGSRDKRYYKYCSKICCMYATKNARLIKKDHPESEVNIFYIDLRTAGRGYEEFFDYAREMGIKYYRGNVSEVLTDGNELIVRSENTFLNEPIEMKSDLVILSTALVPSEGTKKMAEVLHLIFGEDKFLTSLHPKIAPVDTTTTGIFIAGTSEAPKPIQECITEGMGVGSRVATFLKNDFLELDLTTAVIDKEVCMKCGKCAEFCNYDAIDTEGEFYKVVDVACHSCGKCASNCPTNAMELRFFSDEQIIAQVNGILKTDKNSIIAYACNQCGYNAADLAGTAKNSYPKEIKIVRVPCSGRLSLQQLIYPFEKGAKGVFVAACLEGQCHYIDGNIDLKEKVVLVKQALDLLGIGSERLELFNMSSAEGDKFADVSRRMVKQCG